MQVILCDHNCEGHAQAIFHLLKSSGDWLELVPMELKWFRNVELPINSSDEEVWRFCQERGYLLLTGNRRTDDGDESLELTIRRLVTPDILPVLTIGNLSRVLNDRAYCERCAECLAEIVADIARYQRTIRLYL